MKLLVPVDGSAISLKAIEHVASLARTHQPVEVHLINVQPPLPSAVSDYIDEATRHAFHQEEGEAHLRDAKALLDRQGVPYTSHVAVGPVAETIVDYARRHDCDQIVMGSRGLSPIPNLLLGSVATKVLHLSDRPVTIVR